MSGFQRISDLTILHNFCIIYYIDEHMIALEINFEGKSPRKIIIMEDTIMRELIQDVAGVIRDLVTLNLLDREDVDTSLNLNPKTKKYELAVTVSVANPEILFLCLDFFQELRAKRGHSMGVLDNDLCSTLTVEFYEQ